MTMLYPIVLETEENGAVSAYVPGLPVYAAADSHAQAERAIRAVLADYLNAHPASRPDMGPRRARVRSRKTARQCRWCCCAGRREAQRGVRRVLHVPTADTAGALRRVRPDERLEARRRAEGAPRGVSSAMMRHVIARQLTERPVEPVPTRDHAAQSLTRVGA
jgi:hypothetical protein